MKLRSFIFLNFLFSALPVLFSQNELGNPYIHNYTPKEYNSSATIWEITQDHKGLMYFGVAEGVIQYDGTNWQTVVVDNQTTVRSMDVDENGVVYIGAKTEFGYIGRDSLNSPVYVSLSRQLEEKYQDFADVWNVYATKDGVFFLTFKRIYRWHNDQLFTYEYDDITAHLGYYVNDQLFLVLSNRGLHVFENDRFVPVPGGMHFQGESIYCILPFDKDHIIVATRKSGLEKLNTVTGETVLFENDVNEQLKDDKMYSGTMSETGDFVLATLKNGIYVIQKSGKLVAHINQQNGLQNNNVKYVFKDNFGGIWAGTAVGISFIDLNLPLTYFNDENGVSGFTRDVVRHNGTLYVATGNGLFFLDKREIDPQKKFKQLDNADDQFWDFLIVENHLLVGGSHGFYEIIDNKLSRIASFNSNAVFNVLRSNQNPSLIYLALKNGIALAKLNEQGEINVIHQFRDLEVECHQLGEDRKGNLWVATAFDYALRINQTSFDESQGFPLTYEKIEYGEKLSTEEIIRIGDELYMTSSQGLLRAEDDGKLTLKNPFNILNMPEDFTIRRLQQDQNGNLWIHYHFNKLSGQFLALKSPDGTYTIKDDPFTRINEKVSHINSPYVEDNGIVWFHGGEGIVRYDLNKDNNSRKDYRVNIRKVIFSSDSVVKYGNNETHEFEDYQFSFKNNATSFTFSAASYGNEKANQYQYFLEGQDEAWSEWTTMSTKEYNYLHEGKYVFRVRAKNIYNQISQEDQFTFVILPPWYRETWAYVFYVFLFLIFVFIIIKVATYRLEKSKRQLEKVVEERTKDIVKEKEKVEAQKLELEEVHTKLAERNKDVLDSIKYAQRIQSSILPPLDKLKHEFPESFVLYQPRDIVSGDFYWFEKVGDFFITACADCTGHGVPGAFMSMIGTTLLSKAVEQKHVVRCEHALTELDKELQKTLQQTRQEDRVVVMDGMDIALIAINMKNGECHYSGANRPLYLIRDNEVTVYNSNRCSIGGGIGKDKTFEGVNIHVKPGDQLYVFTDGITDQFGGENNKKFKRDRLKKLLLDHCHQPMEEQHEAILQGFNNWKGENEQIDDILVIGIQIP